MSIDSLDIGWLAGLFDGEGCIMGQHINRRNASGGNVSAEVRIEATSLAMMEKISRLLEKAGIYYRLAKCPMRALSIKQPYRLSIYRRDDVVAFLSLIRPSLVVKSAEADAVLSWYERWSDQRGKGTPKASLEEKIVFLHALRDLKRVA